MKSTLRVSAMLLAVVGLLLALAPRPAGAHPMGNFSINQWSAITVRSERIDIRYVVDMAEIPTYTELGTIRTDRSTDLSDKERADYIAKKSAELMKGLTLSIDGTPAELTVESASLQFPAGNAGLPTLRLEMNLFAPVSNSERGSIQYRADNFENRVGWKEIIAVAGEGIGIEKADVPSKDMSKGLTEYNPDLLNSAPNVRSASIQFVSGAVATSTDGQQEQASIRSVATLNESDWVTQQTQAITSVFSQKELPISALLLALMLAFVVGAAHALSPGHGKTVVAAYLVGSRGTPIHALVLGLTVTVSHTIGVFLLGLVVLGLADYILPETLYPWLKFISGVLLALLGLTLFVQRFRAWRYARHMAAHSHVGHSHDHDHDHSHAPHGHHHDHDHEHGHDHSHSHEAVPHKHGLFGRAHTHVPADGQKVGLGALLALGITGGIIPCPSALMVLLVAVQFEKVGLGLLLILAFSVGLAAVLTGIGLLMVYSRGLLNKVSFKRGRGVLGRLPMASALGVCCLGIFLAYGSIVAR